MDFKNIDNKFRPIPFWSWNEKLNTDETKRQIDIMHDAGIGGYFMHARGGLQTEYMSDEWFDNVKAAIDEGKTHGMHTWAYDENGWPSGFGGGIVNSKGVKFQQKYLRCDENADGENTICHIGELRFYYEVNPFYVDTLSKDAVKCFIDNIYVPYYDRFKNNLDGFFTDEPQISRKGIPWSFDFRDTYMQKYGEDLYLKLNELFFETGDWKNTRIKFWKNVTEMFSQNFMKQIYDWCNAHSLKFTGHLLAEETLFKQLETNGACMPHYEYFSIPGMDWLMRRFPNCLTMYQLGSAAQQLGKKQILSETFAMTGHNIGQDELKGLFEWQMVRGGATLLCQHLEGYSIRGQRKRDYPPAMYVQQPWWKYCKTFNNAMSRIGMLMSEGSENVDVLIIHPQTTAWSYYNSFESGREKIDVLHEKLIDTIMCLERKHVRFHLGDEILIERHGSAGGGTFTIGKKRYTKVIILNDTILLDNTKKLIDDYKKSGGVITTADKIKENSVVSSEDITYAKREFDGFSMHYFVNTSKKAINTQINVCGKKLDIETGDMLPLCKDYVFHPYESLVVIDSGETEYAPLPKIQKPIDLSGGWHIESCTENSLTLDFCDYYFDGELIEKNGYILNVSERAIKLERPVKVKCVFKAKVLDIPSEMYLVCETPEKFDIKVNGKLIQKDICGFFRDRTFKKIDVTKYIKEGENVFELNIDFVQSPDVYQNVKNGYVFESEKNKLAYDTEIETVYLTGNFAVKTDFNKYTELDRNASRYTGEFTIVKPQSEIPLTNIERCGYPFFSGEITVSKTINVNDTDYMINFEKTGINVVKFKVNGQDTTFMWEPYTKDISHLLKAGENKIEITLVNNLRNLLGPHHLQVGEAFDANPSSFFKEDSVWCHPSNESQGKWNNDYCFVNTTLKNRNI